MKQVAWLTDIHLNFLPTDQADAFLRRVAASGVDAVLIGGDIGEAHDLVDFLARIDELLPMPVYFVLGNHDFYFGSIAAVRQQVVEFCRLHPRQVYLSVSEPIELAPGVGLVGHDGWADARLGNYEQSIVMMNDYKLIEDFAGLGKQERWPRLQALGDEAAAHLRRVLPAALARFGEVLLLTHVPPLREACWYQRQVSDDHWAPHFTCKAVGDVLLEVMRDHADRKLTVLCGHTHGEGETRPLENLKILTGGAQYGDPQIQRVFSFSARPD